jgi:hypothetical protein
MSERPIVFLDIDGVLNDHRDDPVARSGWIHRDKAARLNRILQAADARVVVTSAWRYFIHRGEMDLAGFEWLLRSHGVMPGRLRGVTRADTMVRVESGRNPERRPLSDERGEQIREWLAINTAAGPPYVVIDDMDSGIVAAGHPFVRTIGSIGLTDDDADRAIAILSRRPVLA